MASSTAVALTGFIAWSLLLVIVMEGLRARYVALKLVPPNEFRPDNSNLSPFMQRLARAHANCIEGLPIFGGLLLVALVTGQSSVTNPLAYPFLAARILQSCAHLLSSSVLIVNIRFAFFVVQLVIAAYWAIRLLSGLSV